MHKSVNAFSAVGFLELVSGFLQLDSAAVHLRMDLWGVFFSFFGVRIEFKQSAPVVFSPRMQQKIGFGQMFAANLILCFSIVGFQMCPQMAHLVFFPLQNVCVLK